MMVKSYLKSAFAITALASALTLQSCGGGGLFGGGGDDGGELIPPQREGWSQVLPYGMTVIPPGTFHMGQADEDITYSKINLNKQVTISKYYMDDTEITNNEYRMFIDNMLGTQGEVPDVAPGEDAPEPWTEQEIMEKLYPDTTVWVHDFTYHMGDPLLRYYYQHPSFDDFPVVGVDWEAANVFCEWRTNYWNTYREDNGLIPMPNFRLPSEAEWEYAARGGRDMAKYPWGGPYMRNTRGCALANFKPGRGNYYDDGYSYAAPVASFYANDYGLHDMAGNVSEWCADAFHPASYPIVWDLNPTYNDESEPRKVVRGGSWKDIMFYVETGTRTYEFQDSARSYIGFRCAMTYLGRSTGYTFGG